MATIERGELPSKQVEGALREMIREGSLGPGKQIPSEKELADLYGVSRATVPDALASLQREGVVVRRQGAGVYVTRAALYLDSRLEEMWNFEDIIRAQGREPRVGWLAYEETSPNRATREKLFREPEDMVLVVRKVFLADEEPVIHCVDYIPRHLIHKAFTGDDLVPQVFDFLEEFAGERAVYYVAELMPTLAEGEIAGRLECRSGTPLIVFDEVAYNIKDEPILCSLAHHHHESLRLKVVRSKYITDSSCFQGCRIDLNREGRNEGRRSVYHTCVGDCSGFPLKTGRCDWDHLA
jgi:GntR family transcriptional regulator